MDDSIKALSFCTQLFLFQNAFKNRKEVSSGFWTQWQLKHVEYSELSAF